MAKITVTEVKSYIKLDVADTTKDTMIQDMINYAYSRLDNYAGINNSDKFLEYGDLLNLSKEYPTLILSGCASDIELSAVKIDGTSINISSDIEKLTLNRWTITNETYFDGKQFYAEYSSATMLARVKKIVMEIAIFETIKLPAFDNFIGRRSFSVNGSETQNIMSDDQFYGKMYKELSEIFLKRL